jgi:hypothetical protein
MAEGIAHVMSAKVTWPRAAEKPGHAGFRNGKAQISES